MIGIGSVRRWSVASNEQAVANARAAATECARLRVERAEVEQFLATYVAMTRPQPEPSAQAVPAGR